MFLFFPSLFYACVLVCALSTDSKKIFFSTWTEIYYIYRLMIDRSTNCSHFITTRPWPEKCNDTLKWSCNELLWLGLKLAPLRVILSNKWTNCKIMVIRIDLQVLFVYYNFRTCEGFKLLQHAVLSFHQNCLYIVLCLYVTSFQVFRPIRLPRLCKIALRYRERVRDICVDEQKGRQTVREYVS